MARILMVLTACAVVALAAESRLIGQQASASLTVSANVSKNCTIVTSPVNFGAYDPVAGNATAPLDGTGTITVTCTKGAIGHVGLNYGTNAVGSLRRMQQSTTSFLNYEIYRDPGRSIVWGNDIGSDLDLPVAPTSSPRVYTAYGRVPQGQDAAVGSYTDTLVATIVF